MMSYSHSWHHGAMIICTHLCQSVLQLHWKKSLKYICVQNSLLCNRWKCWEEMARGKFSACETNSRTTMISLLNVMRKWQFNRKSQIEIQSQFPSPKQNVGQSIWHLDHSKTSRLWRVKLTHFMTTNKKWVVECSTHGSRYTWRDVCAWPVEWDRGIYWWHTIGQSVSRQF